MPSRSVTGWEQITNKRPMGHIAHLRNQFKSINTYHYIIRWWGGKKKTELNGSSVLHLNKIFNPLTQRYFVPCLVEICPGVLEKKILKFRQSIFSISYISPLEKRRGPSFEQTSTLFNQGWFVPILVEIGPVALEKKMKMWKVHDNDDDGQRTNCDQK